MKSNEKKKKKRFTCRWSILIGVFVEARGQWAIAEGIELTKQKPKTGRRVDIQWSHQNVTHANCCAWSRGIVRFFRFPLGWRNDSSIWGFHASFDLFCCCCTLFVYLSVICSFHGPLPQMDSHSNLTKTSLCHASIYFSDKNNKMNYVNVRILYI